MKVIKKTKDYIIYQKSSGRYAIKNADKNWVNADEKIKILLAEKLIKTVAPAPAPKKTEETPAAPVDEAAVTEEATIEEAPVEEAPAEEAPAEEAPAEEAPAEEAPTEEAPAEKPKAKAKAKPKAKAAPKKD
jgi:hypothetical protein